jgi:putative ABC transport system substrate-binding protein
MIGDAMRRREFITLLGGAAAAWPLVARAQQADRIRRVGVLPVGVENDSDAQSNIATFKQGLQALGWREGVNVQSEYRWGEGDTNRIRAHVVELLRLRPDVILAGGSRVLGILWQETRSVPIVFANAFDPVELGFVASLARPGGNITGFNQFENAIAGKWLELLREIAPGVARVGVVGDPDTPSNRVHLQTLDSVARSVGVTPVAAPVHGPADLERAIEPFAREPHGGLIVLPDVTTSTHRATIAALAARYRLPAIYANRPYVTSGGLVSYGVDPRIAYRGAASYVDRILKGAKPADLPVQQPTKYELFVNLKAAKAIGWTISDSCLLRADEVIE